MTDRQHGIFYYFNLQKQSREWLYAIEIDKIEDKYLKKKILDAKKANDKLTDHIERRLERNPDKNYVDQFWNDSENISKIFEFIRNESDSNRKQNLFLLITEFIKGNLKIIEDEPIV